jgi:hypothetical protein
VDDHHGAQVEKCQQQRKISLQDLYPLEMADTWPICNPKGSIKRQISGRIKQRQVINHQLQAASVRGRS